MNNSTYGIFDNALNLAKNTQENLKMESEKIPSWLSKMFPSKQDETKLNDYIKILPKINELAFRDLLKCCDVEYIPNNENYIPIWNRLADLLIKSYSRALETFKYLQNAENTLDSFSIEVEECKDLIKYSGEFADDTIKILTNVGITFADTFISFDQYIFDHLEYNLKNNKSGFVSEETYKFLAAYLVMKNENKDNFHNNIRNEIDIYNKLWLEYKHIFWEILFPEEIYSFEQIEQKFNHLTEIVNKIIEFGAEPIIEGINKLFTFPGFSLEFTQEMNLYLKSILNNVNNLYTIYVISEKEGKDKIRLILELMPNFIFCIPISIVFSVIAASTYINTKMRFDEMSEIILNFIGNLEKQSSMKVE
jgi:hypothetical protein